MFEFAPDAEQSDPRVNDLKEKYFRVPNTVNIVGQIEDPGDKQLHGPRTISGVTAQIVTGKSTRFNDLKNDGEKLIGIVTTKDDEPVPAGVVVITLRNKDGAPLNSMQANIMQSGRFFATIDMQFMQWIWLDAYYVGPHGYADCEIQFKNPEQS